MRAYGSHTGTSSQDPYINAAIKVVFKEKKKIILREWTSVIFRAILCVAVCRWATCYDSSGRPSGKQGSALQEAPGDKRSGHTYINHYFKKYTLFYWDAWVELELDNK